ncbi:MAG: succinate dehydrogenase assembly factor 2 [Gammaproteobacteria bacterium]|nr:succinate dehydrogenase assembly factor 2 [Gammaproteobacteria bacterium]
MATDRAEAQDLHCRRLRWRSRRGMLELELVLAPFVTERLDRLSAADQALYEKLLDHDDWDIFEWIQGRRDIPDPDLVRIVEAIRAAAAL